MSPAPLTPDARLERSARRKWVFIIVGLLLFQVLFGGITIALSLHNRNAIVEHDYYNKALHWDDHEALVQASAQLGWHADITVGASATTTGQRALILTLTDQDGTPVPNATVQVAFFHRADPLNLQQADLKPNAAGTYAGLAPINRQGIWEFRLTVHRTTPVAATDPAAPAASASSPQSKIENQKVGGAKIPDEVFIATLTKDLLE